MPNFKSVVHFLLVDYGEGYLLLLVSCDGGEKSQLLVPTDLRLDCQTGLKFDKIKFGPLKNKRT